MSNHCPLRAVAAILPAAPCTLCHVTHLRSLSERRKKWASWAVPPHNWVSWMFTHMLPTPPVGEIACQKVSLLTELCCLKGGLTQVK